MQINPADISPEVHQAKMRFGIIGNAPALIAAVTRAIQALRNYYSFSGFKRVSCYVL